MAEWHEAARIMRKQGMSCPTIAACFGVSKQRVHQIIRDLPRPDRAVSTNLRAEYARMRYRNDAEFRERLKAAANLRYRTDPEYRERVKAASRERARRLRAAAEGTQP